MEQSVAAITYSSDFGDGWVAFDGDVVVELGLPGAAQVYPMADSAPPSIAALAGDLESYWQGAPLPTPSAEIMESAATTQFTAEIYRRVVAIPGGTTMTYGDVASSLDRPRAARAVGAAMAANRFAPIIPCHRVVGSDGSLRGYAAGIDVKRYLIGMEARVADA